MMTYFQPAETVGEALRQIREEKGLNLRQLGEIVGRNHTWLHTRETSRIRIKPPDLKVIADGLGVTVDDVLGRIANHRDISGFNPEMSQIRNPFGVSRVTLPVMSVAGGLGAKGGIPVVNRGKAGAVVDYETSGIRAGDHSETIDRASVQAAGEDVFAIVVVDESMSPRVNAGEYLVLQPVDAVRATVPDDKVVLVQVSGETGHTLTRWFAVPGRPTQARLAKIDGRVMQRIVERADIASLAIAIERRVRI